MDDSLGFLRLFEQHGAAVGIIAAAATSHAQLPLRPSSGS